MARKITEEDADTGQETTRRIITGFRGAAVFDVAQTDGEPLVDVQAHKLEGDAPAELWDRLESFANAQGYRVELRPTGTAANGFTDPTRDLVVVDPDMSPAMRCKTLAHELGHVLLHASTGGYQGTCRDVAELEAESVAYTVLQRAGIDAGGYSFGYVLHWQGGDDKARATLRASADRIAKAARTIIESVFEDATEAADLAAAA
jgi:antirestriction protein ArdC